MKAWSLIFGYFMINISIGVIHALGLFSVYQEPIISSTAITSVFNLTVFSISAGLAGIAGILTRQFIFGAGALLLWLVGVFYAPIQDIFIGVPRLINILLADSPLVATVVGGAVTAITSIILFMFLFELLSQRQVT